MSLFWLYKGCLPEVGSTIANLSWDKIAFFESKIPFQSGPLCLTFFYISRILGLKEEDFSFKSKAQTIPHI